MIQKSKFAQKTYKVLGWLLQRLLGGRPMIIVGCRVESGRFIFDCIDCFGRLWEARGRWGFLRQRKGQDWEDLKEKKEIRWRHQSRGM